MPCRRLAALRPAARACATSTRRGRPRVPSARWPSWRRRWPSSASSGPEISFDGEPPPRRLAPHAAAVARHRRGDAGNEIGWGRFVLLYDPAGQDGWAGPFRVIAYVRAELEPEIAADPLVGQVGWSWLTEALDARSAGVRGAERYRDQSGTEGFGTKQDEPTATEFEMRASWSPVDG